MLLVCIFLLSPSLFFPPPLLLAVRTGTRAGREGLGEGEEAVGPPAGAGSGAGAGAASCAMVGLVRAVRRPDEGYSFAL